MFEELQPAPADKILALIGLYRADSRPEKLDLGVGVYKDRDGNTPVMRAVRKAEQRLLETQTTTTSLGLAGDLAFNAAMAGLVFGASADAARVRAAQAPGGSGALRLAAEKRGAPTPHARVLAIGDSVRTDLSGANLMGLDCLFMTRGIHAADFAGLNEVDAFTVRRLFGDAKPPRALMQDLKW